METIYDRTRMLIGRENMNRIKEKNVIIFGTGGVGGFVVETLARAGIGKLTLVDFDVVDITNINRQIIALHSTIGRQKTEVMKERIQDINPEAQVTIFSERLREENIDTFHLADYDYVVDAIDDIPAKLLLIQKAKALGTPIIVSMGVGNRFDPSQLKISDIKKTHTCPLAKRIRKACGQMGIKHLKVLFSSENPHREELPEDGTKSPSSISFLPAAAGVLIGAEVVRDLLLALPGDRQIFGIKLAERKIKAED